MTSPASPAPEKLSRSGLLYAFGAYGLWGLFPLYFLALEPATPFEVVGYRILFSLVFCAFLIAVTRKWRQLAVILKQRKLMLTLGVAAVLIYINWQVFILAVLSNQIVESSLGYFINPIVTVVLGVIVLREKLRTMQWVAVGISFVAVIVLTVSYGAIPWISLTLAASFGLYGLIKKRTGLSVDAISGLTIETMWMTPVAIIQLIIVSNLVGLSFFGYGLTHTLLLASAGVVTAVPLIMFGAGARRLPLTAIGLIQYSTPVFSFLMAVFVLHEPMPPVRWVGFFIIWVALIVLTTDMLRHGKANRLARAAEELTIE
ncbi:EamA family transporter RarD [Aurantimicrobium sp. MWH-Uga1]|uniref:EamA family transporter RarD n=1 Tax=Aurantimicrobium sp. MWH-Uga1 TaxID=2079575 RepID=UPI000DED8147|nr:EamA family transporter RarD [Aurantimicrobium sp. MWH-Uga1]AXE53922.1 EamA-like transporter family protein [Aurantimicrobium sp. MWH-Uga1]